MTTPEPELDAPNGPTPEDPQDTALSVSSPPISNYADTDPARPAFVEHPAENTTSLTSPPSPPSAVDRQASRLKRPTHPGRPVHAPGASGLLEASEVPIPKPPSRPASRPAQRPTSLLGTVPASRPSPRPTDPLSPTAAPAPSLTPTATLAPAPSLTPTATLAPEPSPPPTLAPGPEPTPPRLPSSRPATLRPATPRRDTPTALSGPLSAPPGTSPLSPTQPDMDLTVSRPALAIAPSTRPTQPSLPDQTSPLDLPLAASHAHTPSPPRGPRIAIATALLLALVLPSAAHPPWSLLDQPSGPTGLALAGLLLLPALSAGPPHLVRWALRLVVAVTLAALTALALTDGHADPPWSDALDPLHGSLSALGLSLLIGATLADSAHRPPRIAAIAGLLLLLAAALIPGPSGMPLSRLFAALGATSATSSTPSADTAGALATLTFAALAATTAAVRAISPSRRLVLALLTWVCAFAPLVLHAALSTPPSDWTVALGPLKAVFAFAAALLLCAEAIAPALEPEPPGRSEAF